MRDAIDRFAFAMLGVLLVMAGGQVIAQEVELKAQVLGTGYDRETREVSGNLPAEGAIVKRVEGAQVFCLTAFASETETFIYHVWLYRGDEPTGREPQEPQALYYDSVTKETTWYPMRVVLDRTSDLRELTDVRALFVVKLRVGKSGYWRTYSVKRIDFVPSLGTWECRVYNADEQLLGKKFFTVTAD